MKTLYSIFGLIFLFLSCKKEAQPDQGVASIPEVPVDMYIGLNEPAYFNLTAIGGWMYLNGGSRGLIVYRSIEGYNAYDRHTPYKAEQSCSFGSVDSNEVYIVEGCDQSKYLLIDGSVAAGPASQPLKRYRTNVTQGVLRIYN
jgi:hypothetical protein